MMQAQELKDFFRDTLVAQRTIDQEFAVLDALVDFAAQNDTTGIPDWTGSLTFQLDGSDDGTFCTEPDTNGRLRFWKTKVNNNTNNSPPTDPLITENAYWIEVSPSDGSAVKEWAPGVYGSGLIIVYFDVSGTGADPDLYVLAETVRPFNSTNFSTELAAGKWKRMQVSFAGYVSPPEITSDQNNYNPTDFHRFLNVRLSTDELRLITGFGAPQAGELKIIHNVGSFNILFKNEDPGSSAANRFLLPSDITLQPSQSAIFWYDETTLRWRAIYSSGNVVVDGTTITGQGTPSDPLVSQGLYPFNNLSDVDDATESRDSISAQHDRVTVTDKDTDFTPAAADFTGIVPLYRATEDLIITLPSDGSVGISVGRSFYVMVMSGKTVTFSAGSGATMETSSGGGTAVCQAGENFLLVSITKRAGSTWSVQNGRAPSGSFTEFALVATALTFTNMPSGAQEIAAGTTGRYRTKVDLTNFTSIRCCASVSVVGATNAGFYLEYSTDQSSWTTIGSGSGGDIARIGDAIGASVSDWISLPSGAKADVWLRAIGVAGDGAADPVVGRVTAQVK